MKQVLSAFSCNANFRATFYSVRKTLAWWVMVATNDSMRWNWCGSRCLAGYIEYDYNGLPCRYIEKVSPCDPLYWAVIDEGDTANKNTGKSKRRTKTTEAVVARNDREGPLNFLFRLCVSSAKDGCILCPRHLLPFSHFVLLVDKAGATALFQGASMESYNIGVVVNLVRLATLGDFGSPEFVADKLLQPERRKESTKEAELIAASERSGDGGLQIYEFEYTIDSTRGGKKRIFYAAFVA
ncbi:hypothetical protein PIB30_007065 [Stylosanthes scabra]|uniref:PsbP C-terminal domain-containing protein n=1 Tax=Stylosanthes scabra TaxID=79078 RepID=A0ABU6R519_9FABA|nr:hypothetical protein [Stylosanthes scabra]